MVECEVGLGWAQYQAGAEQVALDGGLSTPNRQMEVTIKVHGLPLFPRDLELDAVSLWFHPLHPRQLHRHCCVEIDGRAALQNAYKQRIFCLKRFRKVPCLFPHTEAAESQRQMIHRCTCDALQKEASLCAAKRASAQNTNLASKSKTPIIRFGFPTAFCTPFKHNTSTNSPGHTHGQRGSKIQQACSDMSDRPLKRVCMISIRREGGTATGSGPAHRSHNMHTCCAELVSSTHQSQHAHSRGGYDSGHHHQRRTCSLYGCT